MRPDRHPTNRPALRNAYQHTLAFEHPLMDVRIQGRSPDEDLALRFKAHEQQGYERGWSESQNALNTQLAQQHRDLLEMQKGVLTALGQTLPQVARDGERTLIALALEAAAKLVSDLPITPEMVAATIREALQQVEQTTEYSVLLHPEDLALLKRVNSDVLPSGGDGQPIQFRSAPEVTRGGCVVQSRFGLIDACRERKLELLQKALLQ
jgi:flagellar assembly protein FliH